MKTDLLGLRNWGGGGGAGKDNDLFCSLVSPV